MAEDLSLLALMATRHQPGPDIATVLAEAHAEGRLRGVVPEGNGPDVVAKWVGSEGRGRMRAHGHVRVSACARARTFDGDDADDGG